MSTATPDLTRAVEAAEDPLYDAVLIAFVYAAWAAASVWFGDRTGLFVLVGATAVLTTSALVGQGRSAVRSGQRAFVVDFATILLYCASAIALGILLVDLVT